MSQLPPAGVGATPPSPYRADRHAIVAGAHGKEMTGHPPDIDAQRFVADDRRLRNRVGPPA